jgi:hypothetical protein
VKSSSPMFVKFFDSITEYQGRNKWLFNRD